MDNIIMAGAKLISYEVINYKGTVTNIKTKEEAIEIKNILDAKEIIVVETHKKYISGKSNNKPQEIVLRRLLNEDKEELREITNKEIISNIILDLARKKNDASILQLEINKLLKEYPDIELVDPDIIRSAIEIAAAFSKDEPEVERVIKEIDILQEARSKAK